MSAKVELERLQAKRAELEAASRSLIEEQDSLEESVWILEEKIVAEELKKEKAVVADLRKRNKTAKDSIAQLKAKKKELETKLKKEGLERGLAVIWIFCLSIPKKMVYGPIVSERFKIWSAVFVKKQGFRREIPMTCGTLMRPCC